MLALFCGIASYNAPMVGRPVVSRTSSPNMKAVISFDQDGQFSSGDVAGPTKPPVKILKRIEQLRLLSNVADAGLLSAAEDAQIFSKLEKAGAYSSIEKLLPLADDLKLLSTAEKLLNTDSSALVVAAAALVGAEIGLIAVVPDDNGLLVGLQVATGLLAGAGAVTLVAVSSLFSLLQADEA